jgi:thioredoxin 1
MAGGNTREFTEANFETEVLKSGQPVLVDFWADWCMPCKALGPTIDELATEYEGKVKVGKVDTDANQSLSAQYGISAIPTVILFQNGQIKERFIGLRSKRDFKASLDSVVGVQTA